MAIISKILGHYQITSQIGKGGMGEVYRARDTKLGREVAIKVLPEEFAQDAERMARFQREAKLLAALDHTNIASIYGLEDSDNTHALVMQLAEGPTLADRIRQRRFHLRRLSRSPARLQTRSNTLMSTGRSGSSSTTKTTSQSRDQAS